ncbi:hypothetical protein MHYP_G00070410 [Metynnis hypsauchen]
MWSHRTGRLSKARASSTCARCSAPDARGGVQAEPGGSRLLETGLRHFSSRAAPSGRLIRPTPGTQRSRSLPEHPLSVTAQREPPPARHTADQRDARSLRHETPRCLRGRPPLLAVANVHTNVPRKHVCGTAINVNGL